MIVVSRTLECIRAWAESGATRAETAAVLGLAYNTVVRASLEAGIPFRRQENPGKPDRDSRAMEMARLYRAGSTLQQIGEKFGITRERVRQVLTKDFKLTAVNGGQTIQARRRRVTAAARRDEQYLARHGCTLSQYQLVREMGRQAMAEGGTSCTTPIGAFQNQRRNAGFRKILWDLKFWQWWTIWQESGRWEQRGRKLGQYVMCRKGDSGPYAAWNVLIATTSENLVEYQTKTRPRRLAAAAEQAQAA